MLPCTTQRVPFYVPCWFSKDFRRWIAYQTNCLYRNTCTLYNLQYRLSIFILICAWHAYVAFCDIWITSDTCLSGFKTTIIILKIKCKKQMPKLFFNNLIYRKRYLAKSNHCCIKWNPLFCSCLYSPNE